jgi:hypothetical protein
LRMDNYQDTPYVNSENKGQALAFGSKWLIIYFFF